MGSKRFDSKSCRIFTFPYSISIWIVPQKSTFVHKKRNVIILNSLIRSNDLLVVICNKVNTLNWHFKHIRYLKHFWLNQVINVPKYYFTILMAYSHSKIVIWNCKSCDSSLCWWKLFVEHFSDRIFLCIKNSDCANISANVNVI